MANNENGKRKRLDQPARDTLSALDRALLDLAIDTQDKRPDEFTIKDLVNNANGTLQYSAMNVRAQKLVKEGKWKVRNLKGVNYFSEALQNVTG